MRIDRRSHLLSVVLCLCIVAGGFYLLGNHYYVAPVKSKVDKLKEEIEIQEQVMKRIDTRDDQTDAPSGSGELQLKLPVDKEIDQLLLMIEETAEMAGISIMEFNEIQENEENASEQEEPVSLAEIDHYAYELQGEAEQFEEVDRFLRFLESNERLLRVGRLEIMTENSGLTFTVHLTSYYAPDLDSLLEERREHVYPSAKPKTNPFKNDDGK
ncbi:type 4a pilus biogenesis protein PilO [Virgibacillus senegalensis]|uniref:type 4a pilus biogenesis protein PilO n=1 Tax=Virgibacillus senegalensis TaxID=1499679 RepID=UPI00069F2B68|nr:type 4a pilus biogenesis protein PilO [Virgibacillus senegalensis]